MPLSSAWIFLGGGHDRFAGRCLRARGLAVGLGVRRLWEHLVIAEPGLLDSPEYHALFSLLFLDRSGELRRSAPILGLSTVARYRVALDELAERFVAVARADGRSWAWIGAQMGVSKQVAYQQYSGPYRRPAGIKAGSGPRSS